MVKMTMKRKIDDKDEETLTFAFPLPHTKMPIIYNE